MSDQATTVERKFVLTRLEGGDYLLPGNSGETLWRIARGQEEAESGRMFSCWQVWRAPARIVQRMRAGTMGVEDLEWSEWECWESFCKTREEAVQSALREDARR
jgi:hypothetical protein